MLSVVGALDLSNEADRRAKTDSSVGSNGWPAAYAGVSTPPTGSVEKRRIGRADGNAYAFDEFMQGYGSTAQWDAAGAVVPPNRERT